MVKYKVTGEQLAVKGINCKMILALNLFCFIILSGISFLIMLTIKFHATEILLLTLMLFVFCIILILQFISIRGFLKERRKVTIFNKVKGLIVFHSGRTRKEIFIGHASHWYIQKAFHKARQNRGICDYHAVIVGNKGKAYIGLSAMTKSSLKKKLKRLNEYFELDFKVSTNVLTTNEILKEIKCWGYI